MQESGTIATFGSTYTVLTVHVITKHHYIKVHVHTFYSLSMYYRSMNRGWGLSLTTLSGTGNPNQSVALLQAKKGFSEVSSLCAVP